MRASSCHSSSYSISQAEESLRTQEGHYKQMQLFNRNQMILCTYCNEVRRSASLYNTNSRLPIYPEEVLHVLINPFLFFAEQAGIQHHRKESKLRGVFVEKKTLNTVSLKGEIECSGPLANCHPCPYRCTNVILARTFYMFFSMLTFTVTFPVWYRVGSWTDKQTVCYYNHIF